MTDLTRQELLEKIERVKSDITKHSSNGDQRLLTGLHDYVEYLEYELKELDKK